MNEVDRDDAALDARVAELPKEIQPGRDLWPAIEARITAPARRSRWSELALAAGVAAIVSGAMFYWLERSGTRDPDAQTAYVQLDATYQPLRQAALQRYRGRAEQLDPALRRSVEANLAIIDRALTEIQKTLADRPNDPALRQMLQWTYAQELAVIDAVMTQPAADGAVNYRGEL